MRQGESGLIKAVWKPAIAYGSVNHARAAVRLLMSVAGRVAKDVFASDRAVVCSSWKKQASLSS